MDKIGYKKKPDVGDSVVYRTFGGTLRSCEILSLFCDEGSEKPGFYGKIISNNKPVWGYNDQIVRYLVREYITPYGPGAFVS